MLKKLIIGASVTIVLATGLVFAGQNTRAIRTSGV